MELAKATISDMLPCWLLYSFAPSVCEKGWCLSWASSTTRLGVHSLEEMLRHVERAHETIRAMRLRRICISARVRLSSLANHSRLRTYTLVLLLARQETGLQPRCCRLPACPPRVRNIVTRHCLLLLRILPSLSLPLHDGHQLILHQLDSMEANQKKPACPRCGTAYSRDGYHRMYDSQNTICPQCGTVYNIGVHHEGEGVHRESKGEATCPRPGAGEVTPRPEIESGSANGTRPPPFPGPKIGGAQPLHPAVLSRDQSCGRNTHADQTTRDTACKGSNKGAEMSRNAPLPHDLRSPLRTNLTNIDDYSPTDRTLDALSMPSTHHDKSMSSATESLSERVNVLLPAAERKDALRSLYAA